MNIFSTLNTTQEELILKSAEEISNKEEAEMFNEGLDKEQINNNIQEG